MKNAMRKIAALLLSATMLLSLCSCAQQNTSGNPASSTSSISTENSETPTSSDVTREDMYVTLATGPNSSTHYMALSCIANLLSNEYPNYTFAPEITSGGTENIRMISAGNATIGMAQADAMVAGFEGTREFDDSTAGKINFMMGTFITCFHQFTQKDSSINSFTDLKGKKCGVAKGTLAQVFWPMLLEYHGMTEDDVETVVLSFADIVVGVQDGTLDYGIHICGYPNSQLSDMSVTSGVKMLSFDPAYCDAMIADNPYLGYTTIPEDVYGSEAYTLCTRNIMICSADADEQLIYDFLKATLDHPEDLAMLGTSAAQFNKENALDYSNLIPMHPGAERLYKELGML